MLFTERHPSCIKKILGLVRELQLEIVPESLNREEKIEMFSKLWNRLQSIVESPAKFQVIAFMGYFIYKVYIYIYY
jgi:hypothetical protein